MAKGNSKVGGARGKPNDATEYYVSGEGMWINQYLRGRGDFGELSDDEKQFIEDLDVATDGKITDDVLYRSVDASAILGNMGDVDNTDLFRYLQYGADAWGKGAYAKSISDKVAAVIKSVEGKEITEKGYMSTTTDRGVAEQWGDFTGASNPVVLEIKTNKKTRGVNLSQYDRNVDADEAQHERLLARNQKYKVKRIYAKNGHIYVDAEMR